MMKYFDNPNDIHQKIEKHFWEIFSLTEFTLKGSHVHQRVNTLKTHTKREAADGAELPTTLGALFFRI